MRLEHALEQSKYVRPMAQPRLIFVKTTLPTSVTDLFESGDLIYYITEFMMKHSERFKELSFKYKIGVIPNPVYHGKQETPYDAPAIWELTSLEPRGDGVFQRITIAPKVYLIKNIDMIIYHIRGKCVTRYAINLQDIHEIDKAFVLDVDKFGWWLSESASKEMNNPRIANAEMIDWVTNPYGDLLLAENHKMCNNWAPCMPNEQDEINKLYKGN